MYFIRKVISRRLISSFPSMSPQRTDAFAGIEPDTKNMAIIMNSINLLLDIKFSRNKDPYVITFRMPNLSRNIDFNEIFFC